jgi:uncharacterized membrane protein YdbT with pleckstrin-like domain
MEMHEGEQLIWRGHPAARSAIGFYLKWGLLALLPVAFAGVVKANGEGTGLPYWMWITLSLLLLGMVVAADILRRAGVDYVLTTHRIRIRRGILSRREQSTRIDRVQNINTNQRLLDRILGIGAVEFETAGTEAQGATFRFAGVADPHGLVAKLETYLAQLRELAAGEAPTGGA